MKISNFLFLIVFLSLAVFCTKPVLASEGTVELKSTNSQSYRCFAASVQSQKLVYTVLVTCRDLVYPAGDNIFSYVLWASPSGQGRPVNLGSLGLGRVTASTKESFIGLFVTTESNPKTKSPTGPTVMSGSVKRISFLDNPSGKSTYVEPDRPVDETVVTTPTTEPKKVNSTNVLTTGLKRAGIAFVLALITAMVIIFFVTKSKK